VATRTLEQAGQAIAPITAAAVALAFFVLNVLAAGGGSRDYDEGVYWQTLRSLIHGHRLFSEIFAPQGPVFFYALLPFYSLLGHSIVAARVGVAVYSLLGAAAIYVAAWRLAGPWAGLIGVMLLTTDFIWAAEAQTLHAEVPSLALGLVAIALVSVAVTRDVTDGWSAWLIAGAGAALALGTASKAFVIIFAVPLALLVAVSDLRNRVRLLYVGAAGFGFVAVAVFLPFAGTPRLLYQDLIASHLAAGRAMNAGMAANFRLLHLGRELPLELSALALAVIALIRHDRLALPAIAWIAATILALLLYQPLFPHEVALLIAPLAFLIAIEAPHLGRMIRFAPADPGVPMAGALVVLVIGVLALSRDLPAWQAARRPNPHEQQLASAIGLHSPPGAAVIGDNPFAIALADRDTPPPLVDTSFARVLAGTLRAQDIETIALRAHVPLMVFDTGRLDAASGLRQWAMDLYPQVVKVDGGTVYFVQR
jgi:4-amino-4-deoxy-L-arabinose transferase-like glycosyltransferase